MRAETGWIALGACLAAVALADLAIATFGDLRNETVAGVVMGFTFAQILLLAVWSSLGPWGVLLRMTSGLVLTALVCLTIAAAGGYRVEGISVAGAMALQWFLIQLPLWAVRLCFRLRLGWSENDGACPNETQFGIQQLLIWTAVVAAVLAIAKRIVPSSEQLAEPDEVIAVLVLLSVFNTLLAWPIVWAAFAHHWIVGMIVATAMVAAICVAEINAFRTVFGPSVDEEVFYILNGIQWLAATVSLLALRWGGLRFVAAAAIGRR